MAGCHIQALSSPPRHPPHSSPPSLTPTAPLPRRARLPHLEAQCGSWSGPVSAAVWLPLDMLGSLGAAADALEVAQRELDALHERLDEEGEEQRAICAF